MNTIIDSTIQSESDNENNMIDDEISKSEVNQNPAMLDPIMTAIAKMHENNCHVDLISQHDEINPYVKVGMDRSCKSAGDEDPDILPATDALTFYNLTERELKERAESSIEFMKNDETITFSYFVTLRICEDYCREANVKELFPALRVYFDNVRFELTGDEYPYCIDSLSFVYIIDYSEQDGVHIHALIQDYCLDGQDEKHIENVFISEWLNLNEASRDIKFKKVNAGTRLAWVDSIDSELTDVLYLDDASFNQGSSGLRYPSEYYNIIDTYNNLKAEVKDYKDGFNMWGGKYSDSVEDFIALKSKFNRYKAVIRMMWGDDRL